MNSAAALEALEQAAAANRRPISREDARLSIYSAAEAHSRIGRIVCSVDHAHGNPGMVSAGRRGNHLHTTFSLNGKRISKAALIAKLNG